MGKLSVFPPLETGLKNGLFAFSSYLGTGLKNGEIVRFFSFSPPRKRLKKRNVFIYLLPGGIKTAGDILPGGIKTAGDILPGE